MNMDAAFIQVWQAESPWVVAWAVLCALLLLRRRGDSRGAVINTFAIFLTATLAQLAAGLLFAANMGSGGIALFNVALLIAGVAAIRMTGMLVFRSALPAAGLSAPRIVEDLVTILGYLVWIIARLRATGMDPSSILASTAVVTAVMAFALQDTLGNMLGGVAIQLDNSITIGDWIRVDDVVGRVTDIRWRSTSIETRNWETVVIPNSALMKGKFAVLGRRQDAPLQWRRHVLFNVDLASPPTRVIPAIEQAIREAEIAHLARHPQPTCVILDFEHGYGRYDLRYWLTDLNFDDPTDSQVRVHIYTALQRAGLRLAVEERDIRLTEQTEARRREVYEREIERRLTALKSVDLLAGLNADELRTVAERLTYSPFAQGEIITRQGNVAHWLYILTAGEADILAEAEGLERRFVNSLGAGSFFGEAGLLTGAPRSATVVARTNVECYRLDKASFQGVLMSRPELAEQMSHVMAARQGALAAAIAGHEIAARDHAGRSAELLARIRSFFGLNA
jgi:small-conductance mechanosensitive channel/CRP-like cAMP-binding protein